MGEDREQPAREELYARVLGLVSACRHELIELEKAEVEAGRRYETVLNTFAALVAVESRLHPFLQERVRRLLALLRSSASAQPAERDRFFSTVERELTALADSPVWEVVVTGRGAVRPAVREDAAAVLAPGTVDESQLVLFALGDLRFAVRGRLEYNIRRYSPGQEYRVRPDSGPLEIFPLWPESLQSEQADGGLMVFRTADETGWLGLRYDRILGIEDARTERLADLSPDSTSPEALGRPHPRLAGRLHWSGRDFYLIRL